MKAENLTIMKKNDINVPGFVVVNHEDELTPLLCFLLGQDKKYAVRSSFDGEDGLEKSFAGQFETLLNVEKKDLKNAIKQVRESVNKKNIQEYSNQCKAIKTSIIVQEMIDSEYSGVMFTANPQGILNETVVVVGHGLGNNVVEDKINTTTYFYNQDDDCYHTIHDENTPILQEKTLLELINIAGKIKNIFGMNMDIEFAIQNDIIYILQARPITTINDSHPLIFDNSNIVESYPGVSLPLTQDFVQQIYHDIFYNLCLRITNDKSVVNNMEPQLQNMTNTINWRIYYQIDNWYAVLSLLPFSSKIIPIWQKMMGVNNLNRNNTNIEIPLSTKFNVFLSFFKFLFTTPKHMNKLNESFPELLLQCNTQVDNCNNIQGLLDLFDEIKHLMLQDWDITLVNDMYTFIYTTLAGGKNQESLANVKNLESMKPVLELQNLIDLANEHGEFSSQYLNALSQYIEDYGDRCLCELKLETETYRTNPALLSEYIQSHLKDSKLEELHDPTKSKNLFVKRAKIGIHNREISRLNRSRIFGLARKIFLKIGQLLVLENRLLSPTDVFYLYFHELSKDCDFKEIVLVRKLAEKGYLRRPAYTRLVFSEQKIEPSETQISQLNSQNSLSGISTSRGCVRGQVLIVDVPSADIDTTGKILVTKSTDPGWVFLMKNAIGIVAERGSLLSHTAIIARELNKPALVNVKNCTQMLKNGDWIELDANNGVINIIREDINNEI